MAKDGARVMVVGRAICLHTEAAFVCEGEA